MVFVTLFGYSNEIRWSLSVFLFILQATETNLLIRIDGDQRQISTGQLINIPLLNFTIRNVFTEVYQVGPPPPMFTHQNKICVQTLHQRFYVLLLNTFEKI